MNQTARISLQYSINVKEQNCHPKAKNQTDAPIFRRARLAHPSDAAVSPACFPNRSASPPFRPVCPRGASAPPVRGLLRLHPNTRNPKNAKNRTFQKEKSQIKQNQHLTQKQSQKH
ncbi:hypothetical protein [Leisingera sp. JC11]|uniref:hypothetical protein n=1 Tax=Leisingera sp. JC11 TaxID=3042469 RepID=UPI003453E363